MKLAKIVFIATSAWFTFLLLYSIADVYVSLKYEIDEVRWLGNTVSIDLAEEYLFGQIRILRYFLYYVLINIVFLFVSLLKEKQKNKE